MASQISNTTLSCPWYCPQCSQLPQLSPVILSCCGLLPTLEVHPFPTQPREDLLSLISRTWLEDGLALFHTGLNDDRTHKLLSDTCVILCRPLCFPSHHVPGWKTVLPSFILASMSTVPTRRSSVTPRGICTKGASRSLRGTSGRCLIFSARPSCAFQVQGTVQQGLNGKVLAGVARRLKQMHAVNRTSS